MVQKAIRFHIKGDDLPFPHHVGRAHGANLVFHAAARRAKSGKIMPPYKILGLLIQIGSVNRIGIMQRPPLPEGIARAAVPDVVHIFFARASIARMEIQ